MAKKKVKKTRAKSSDDYTGRLGIPPAGRGYGRGMGRGLGRGGPARRPRTGPRAQAGQCKDLNPMIKEALEDLIDVAESIFK